MVALRRLTVKGAFVRRLAAAQLQGGNPQMKFLVAIVLLIAAIAPAYAYIDPGSGSYMLQMAMAGILALAFTIKLSWQRLKAFAARILTGHDRPGARGGV
jgi:hypothetical protein